MICILLSIVNKISSPDLDFFIIFIVSIGLPILSCFTFFRPLTGDRVLFFINSMPSCPLSSMSVNPMIFENDSPPRYDLLFSFMKYMYGIFSCLIFIYSSWETCLLIYNSFLFLFFNITDFNFFLDMFSLLARIDID